MKKHYLYIMIAIISSVFTACDYLDLVPEKDIETFESIFERKASADVWLTQSTEFMASSSFTGFTANVGVTGADELVTGDQARKFCRLFKIGDGLQASQDPLDNIWTATYYSIRMLNTFIERIDDVYNMTDAEKRNWKAEAIAVKAFYYFELVKRYGPIVLVPKNIDVNADLSEMQIPRSHVDTCFNEIVRLLDEAIPELYYGRERIASHKLFPSREGAMALKARVLLYQASPLFNGNEFYVNFKDKSGKPYFSTEVDPEKWRRAAEAADEAVQLCLDLGYKLKNGEGDKATKLLNQMRNVEMSIWDPNYQGEEAIFLTGTSGCMHTYVVYTLPIFPEGHPDRWVSINGGVAPSMKMVEMFYTRNGLPLDMDKTWNYANRYKMGREVSNEYANVVELNADVLNLHLKREPRFYANIAADRCYWQRGATSDKNMLVECYQGETFGLHETYLDASTYQNLTGYYLKKFSRTEVPTYQYTSNVGSIGDCRWPMIRLAELYLIQAEAWNEYEGPSEKVYKPLNKVRERAGIPDVEDSWENFSTQPNRIKTKEGMRDIIRHENAVEFAFEGHRFWDLRRWKIAHEELNDKLLGWNVLGDNERKFYNNYEGPVVVWDKATFVSPRDYLYPIKAEEAMIAGYVQNPGW